ncbi:MAG: redox-sensing transcriptional repressor Rex [Actinobacteria bacterium 69-20]|nr:MAG: redox-sensing transcriptional repressor Rex [Actinobacteria bacterium 69-20]
MSTIVADGATPGEPARLPTIGAAPEPGLRLRTIPEATVARLTTYLRVLDRCALVGAELRVDGTISSDELAALVGINPAKLRKDLSYLGSHGTRGVGYDAAALRSTLQQALGAHETYPVAVVGVGHLGSALAAYPGFPARGFPVRALFDTDPLKIGRPVAGITVSDIREAALVCRREDVVIGVIATPEPAAQRVADVLVAAGVRSILGFAPGQLTVPADVEVRRVDLALELQLLAFHEIRRGDVAAARQAVP